MRGLTAARRRHRAWQRRHAAGAADGKMVLGTWGGDYSKLLTQNVETPLLKPKGIEVVHDIAGDSQRRAKLIAEQRLPRGTTDLQALSAAGSREMFNAGILESIDYAKIPNAPHLLPPMKTPYSVGHIYSGQVILYNPAMISPAPTSLQRPVGSRSTPARWESSTSSTWGPARRRPSSPAGAWRTWSRPRPS